MLPLILRFTAVLIALLSLMGCAVSVVETRKPAQVANAAFLFTPEKAQSVFEFNLSQYGWAQQTGKGSYPRAMFNPPFNTCYDGTRAGNSYLEGPWQSAKLIEANLPQHPSLFIYSVNNQVGMERLDRSWCSLVVRHSTADPPATMLRNQMAAAGSAYCIEKPNERAVIEHFTRSVRGQEVHFVIESCRGGSRGFLMAWRGRVGTDPVGFVLITKEIKDPRSNEALVDAGVHLLERVFLPESATIAANE